MVAFENKGAMAATVVVAASDSLNKAAANYVCDGTADNVEIQAAIDALPAGGGKVVLLEGIYNLVNDIHITRNNIILEGQGPTSQLIQSSASENVITIQGEVGTHIYNIQIRHLLVYGAQDTSGRGICCFYADKVYIDDIYATHNFEQGIEFRGGNIYCKIENCICWDNDGGGISFRAREGLIAGDGNIEFCSAVNNIVYSNTGFGADGLEINVNNEWAGDIINVSLIGNHSYNNNGHGIDVKGAGDPGIGASHYIIGLIIMGNHVYDNTGGIYMDAQGLYGITNAIVEGNTVYSNSANAAIEVRQCRSFNIVGNIISESTADGIYLTDSTRCSIMDNLCYKNRYGININDSSHIVLTGNICMNNSDTRAGIILQGADTFNCVISGNICSDDQGIKTQTYGIREAVNADYNSYIGNVTLGNNNLGVNNGGGGHSSFDKDLSSVKLDLSGAATDIEIYHAVSPGILVGYTILYTEASSADAGVNVRIGRYQNGVALDDDYFDVSVSEISKNLGYSKNFVTADLTNKIIAAGDTITVGTAGGKTGTGEVMIILQIAEMAD